MADEIRNADRAAAPGHVPDRRRGQERGRARGLHCGGRAVVIEDAARPTSTRPRACCGAWATCPTDAFILQGSLRGHLREGAEVYLPPDSTLTSRYRYSCPSKTDLTRTRSSLP